MIDVVMTTWSPTKRRWKYFQQSFESFKYHTKLPHRLIVIDNGPEVQTRWLREQEIDLHITPAKNLGIGVSRNLGAAHGDGEFLVLLDNDIGYFEGWLEQTIQCLKDHTGVIATPVKSKPMFVPKYKVGMRGEYELYSWAACMAMVMTREDFNIIGGFDEQRQNVGNRWNRWMGAKGYKWIYHPDWSGEHLDPVKTYHYKRQVFNDGIWTTKPECRFELQKSIGE